MERFKGDPDQTSPLFNPDKILNDSDFVKIKEQNIKTQSNNNYY